MFSATAAAANGNVGIVNGFQCHLELAGLVWEELKIFSCMPAQISAAKVKTSFVCVSNCWPVPMEIRWIFGNEREKKIERIPLTFNELIVIRKWYSQFFHSLRFFDHISYSIHLEIR